jgi:hypothetical protein
MTIGRLDGGTVLHAPQVSGQWKFPEAGQLWRQLRSPRATSCAVGDRHSHAAALGTSRQLALPQTSRVSETGRRPRRLT